MISEINNTLKFNRDLIAQANELSAKSLGWFKSIREESLFRLKNMSLPNRKEEDWRYININDIAQKTFSFPRHNSRINTEAFTPYSAPNEQRLVFYNGFYAPELSTALDHQGITVSSINDAGKNELADLKRTEEKATNYFSELNNILAFNGTLISIEAALPKDTYLHILHVTDNSAADTIISPKTLIRVKPSCSASILESHVSFESDFTCLVNAATDIFLAENALLSYYKFQRESPYAYHIGHTRVFQDADSNFESLTATTSGKITRNSLVVALNGPGTSTMINGLYVINNDSSVDNHTAVDHRFPHGTSRQLYKGLLAGKAHGVFNGKVSVRSPAQQTNSYQLNKNLLLSADCRVDTKPQLEINADDVKCSHGATIGQLNNDEIFYLQTRGIGKESAATMLAGGFVAEMFQFVNNAEILKKLRYIVEPVLNKIV